MEGERPDANSDKSPPEGCIDGKEVDAPALPGDIYEPDLLLGSLNLRNSYLSVMNFVNLLHVNNVRVL